MVRQAVSFGRRGVPRQPIVRVERAGEITPAAADEPVARQAPGPQAAPRRLLDDDRELRDWKRKRREGYDLPWKQMSLMATLCFGLGALVLPSSVNGAVQWLLYGLAGASLYVGFRHRRAAKTSSASRD